MTSTGGTPLDAVTRCFYFDDRGHHSRERPDSNKGPKCFACCDFGHKSFECPVKGDRVPYEAPNVYQVNYANNDDRILKPVVIPSYEALALINTGCDINICWRSFESKLINVTSEIC
jgi:hypothetical protein